MNQLVTSRPRLAVALKWGIAALAVIVIAPLTWMLVGGLVGIAVAGVLGLVIINGAPVVSMKLSNLRLKAIKGEASKNPIETLQLQQSKMEEDLSNEAQKINQFDAAVESYRSALVKEAESHPEAAQAGVPTLHQMERLLGFRRAKYVQAVRTLKSRRKKVELAESRYRVAMAAQAVSVAAGDTDTNLMTKILEDIAFTAVDESVSVSLAALRTAIMVEEVPEHDVDVPAIRTDSTLLLPSPTGGIDSHQLIQQLQSRSTVNVG